MNMSIFLCENFNCLRLKKVMVREPQNIKKKLNKKVKDKVTPNRFKKQNS